MKLNTCSVVAVCAGAALSSAALAQPTATNLGTLTSGTQNLTNITLDPATVVWYRFTLANPLPSEGFDFLDIDSEGSALAPNNDTEIGLYDSTGNLIATNDDGGSGLLSLLSFGATLPRPAMGGLAYAGQNGPLPAGEYYLALGGFNTTFNASAWDATSTSSNAGPAQLNLTLGTFVVPPGAYIESGDAGDLPGTAQAPSGAAGASIPVIFGQHSSGDVDMYRITMCDPANFSASTVGGAGFDTQLFLFDATGMGIAFNDDAPAGSAQSALSNMFTSALPAGEYLLAISQYNNDANSAGGLIWANSPFNVERAPDGPGAAGPVESWTGGGTTAGGYSIALTGVCYAGGAACYANCDNSTTPPILNVADFTCFLQRFAAGESYANCDQSTTPPVLNVADFTCFLQSFAAGCP